MWLSKAGDWIRNGEGESGNRSILDFGLRIENCTSSNGLLGEDYFAIIKIEIFLT
jgi:hypothetical protein